MSSGSSVGCSREDVADAHADGWPPPGPPALHNPRMQGMLICRIYSNSCESQRSHPFLGLASGGHRSPRRRGFA